LKVITKKKKKHERAMSVPSGTGGVNPFSNPAAGFGG